MPATGEADDLVDATLTETNERPRAKAVPKVLAPFVFVVLDCDRPAAGSSRHSLAMVDRVVLGRGSVRCSERTLESGDRALVLALPDPRASSRHAQLVRNGDGFTVWDLDSRNGTRVNGARVKEPTPLSDGDSIQLGHTILLYRSAMTVPMGQEDDSDSSSDGATHLLSTMVPSLEARSAALARVAISSAPILLLGETGTGKEVLARAIHRASGRRGAFAAINCGALPATLLEAQLFGHMRGAFSGAVEAAPGLIRSAEGGTLLLDEVGDLPPPAQAALLRSLQEQEVIPIGGARPIKVDFRLVAATNRPLEALAKKGEFRSDLFARIAGFTFSLPPLRTRCEDLGLIVAALVGESTVRFTPAAGHALLRYDWPLNVRELRQALLVATALAGDQPIDVAHLPPSIAGCEVHTPGVAALPTSDEALRRELSHALERQKGNVAAVARDLGKAPMQVHRWMRRWGIDPRSFRSRV